MAGIRVEKQELLTVHASDGSEVKMYSADTKA